MANQRAAGQKLISIPMSEDFISRIDRSLARMGYSDRSSFIRDAIVRQLVADGVELPAGIELAPSRTGKGGPKRKVSSDLVAQALAAEARVDLALNDKDVLPGAGVSAPSGRRSPPLPGTAVRYSIKRKKKHS